MQTTQPPMTANDAMLQVGRTLLLADLDAANREGRAGEALRRTADAFEQLMGREAAERFAFNLFLEALGF